MAAEDTITWGEVCKQVGFADNLYRTCREKVPGFDGFQEMEDEDDFDFDAEIKDHLQPIPEPPPADWKAPDEPDYGKWLMYGVGALFAGSLLLGKKGASAKKPSSRVTSPKAA